MNKHLKRVQSEFESILLNLSYDNNASHDLAISQASSYLKDYATKKNLTTQEQESLYDFCMDMIDDWFPDTTFVLSFKS